MLKITKRIISTALAFIMISSLGINAFAANLNNGKVNIFVCEDGKNIEYYLDENGMPYNYNNGEKAFLLIPLASLEIKDSKELARLNSELGIALQEINNSKTLRSVPTSYYNMMQNPVNVASNHYYQFMSFEAQTSIATAILRMYAQHSVLRVRTANLGKPSILSSKKVNAYVDYYSSSNDTWYRFANILNTDFTGTNGVLFGKNTDTSFAKITMQQANNPVWFTLDVWTNKS